MTDEHIPPTKEDLVAFFMERDPHTVHGALGIRATNVDADAFTIECDISERLYQHAGIVHGGVYVLLAESAASGAAALTVDVTKFRVAGQEISASHVRASTSGTLKAVARLIHKGRTQLVYAIDVENDGRLVSTVRCTIAVRPINA